VGGRGDRGWCVICFVRGGGGCVFVVVVGCEWWLGGCVGVGCFFWLWGVRPCSRGCGVFGLWGGVSPAKEGGLKRITGRSLSGQAI